MNKMICVALSTLLSFSSLAAEKAESVEKTNDQLAKDMANPNTPLTSLRFRTRYQEYTGDIPGADEQTRTSTTLQPTLPFPLENGSTLYVRPAINYYFDQPVFDASNENSFFKDSSGLGDSTIDVQYGKTEADGFLWSYGATTTLPTASKSELGVDAVAIGPGFQLGQVNENNIIGGFYNYQGDVSGDDSVSLSTFQFFGVYLPGGGWSVAVSPIMTYNHDTEEATIPLNLGIGRTMKLGNRAWKFAVEVNYFVEQPDAFGPQWMIGIDIAPVMENIIASWFN